MEFNIYYIGYITKNHSGICNACHYLMKKAMNFDDVAAVPMNGNDYRIHFWYISKNDAIALMTNSDLNDKNGILESFFHYI